MNLYFYYSIAAVNLFLFFIFIVTKTFYPFLILMQLFSVFALLLYSLRTFSLGKYLIVKKNDVIIICILLLISLWVRIYQIDMLTPGMYGDEVTVALISMQVLHEPEIKPFLGDYSHPTFLLYLTGWSIALFGHTVFAVRLPSIFFGVMSIPMIYLLLRLFFVKKIALLGAILLAFQYSHIILSRLAYEASASLFFQILSILFYVLYCKIKNINILILLAVTIGGGLYTYLNFRLFAVVLILLTLIVLFKKDWKQNLTKAFLFFAVLFITVMPLCSYAVIDPKGFSGRANEISVFSQGYDNQKIMTVLAGNAYRTAVLPFIGIANQDPPISGDPNPGKNPSGVPMFDPLTSVVVVIGIILLVKKNRHWLPMIILLLFPAFLSDIFSVETVPGLSYAGLGHPNMLRVSGLIVGIIFITTYTLNELHKINKMYFSKYGYIALVSLVLIICLTNWHWYFDQQYINRKFYLYNYKVNHADDIQMIDYLNNTDVKNVRMTKRFAKNNEYIRFFLKPAINISNYDFSSSETLLKIILKSDATVIEIDKHTVPYVNAILASNALEVMGYTMHEVRGIVDQPDIIIFKKIDR